MHLLFEQNQPHISQSNPLDIKSFHFVDVLNEWPLKRLSHNDNSTKDQLKLTVGYLSVLNSHFELSMHLYPRGRLVSSPVIGG